MPLKNNGGGGRIRTAEPEGTDLQSVVFSHFTTPPKDIYKTKWWRMTGSNRRPSACKADALPAELILQAIIQLFRKPDKNNLIIFINFRQVIFYFFHSLL